MAAVVAPVLHTYEAPFPLAVNVVDPPAHKTFVPAIETVGKGLIRTILCAVFVHPLTLVTVTEYVVVTRGITVIDAVVALVFHKYVPPPLAVNVVDWLRHNTLFPVISTAGSELTVTVLMAVPEHPLPSVAVTV